MIRLEQANQGRGARGDATAFLGRGDLIANVRTCRGAQTLTPAVGSEEDPSMACEDGTECIECTFAEHAGGAAVVIDDSGEGAFASGLEQDSVECDVAAGEGDDIGRREGEGGGEGGETEEENVFRHRWIECSAKDRARASVG